MRSGKPSETVAINPAIVINGMEPTGRWPTHSRIGKGRWGSPPICSPATRMRCVRRWPRGTRFVEPDRWFTEYRLLDDDMAWVVQRKWRDNTPETLEKPREAFPNSGVSFSVAN